MNDIAMRHLERDRERELLHELIDWIQEENLVEDFEEWLDKNGMEQWPDTLKVRALSGI